MQVLTARANDRAAEFEDVLASDLLEKRRKQPSHLADVGQFADIDFEHHKGEFAELEAETDKLLSQLNPEKRGKASTQKELERGKMLKSACDKTHSHQQFRVALPAKPFAVKVEVHVTPVNRIIPPLQIYASTDNEKPSKANCQLKGAKRSDDEKVLELTYQHCQWDDNQLVAPASRNLFLLVEKQGTLDADFQITFSFHKAKMRMSAEQLKRLQTSKAGTAVESKIRELQNPEVYRVFQNRISRFKAMQRRNLLARTRDVVATNIENAGKDPVDLWNVKREKIFTARIRRAQALENKEILEDEHVEKAQCLMMKEEIRKEKQKLEEQEKIRLVQLHDWQRQWVEYLAVAAFTAHLSLEWRAIFRRTVLRREQTSAINLLESAWIRSCCLRRRKMLYRNILRFQRAAVVVARHCKLAEACQAQGIILSFFNFAINQASDDSSLMAHIKLFNSKVRCMQHRWRTICNIRHTRVDILEPFFRAIETEIKCPGQKAEQIRQSVVRTAKTIQLLPQATVRDALYKYVVEEQKLFPARSALWHEVHEREVERHEFAVFTNDVDTLAKFKWTRKVTPLDVCKVHQLPEEMSRLNELTKETLDILALHEKEIADRERERVKAAQRAVASKPARGKRKTDSIDK
eukprot:GEMP01022578.1.p1 GENE.GEMP01022578.1~~GEMP01022578.1.p1  ORF type:complete len:693 (+),score=145.52 GEMP01022578.1:172-2079(+)